MWSPFSPDRGLIPVQSEPQFRFHLKNDLFLREKRKAAGKTRDFQNGLAVYKNGRGERIRTSDPLVPNQVRYQTAPRPEGALMIGRARLGKSSLYFPLQYFENFLQWHRLWPFLRHY